MTRLDAPGGAASGPGRIGTLNHMRLTVTSIAAAEAFYDPLLRFMGYRLVERDDKRLAWAGWTSFGVLQWVILSAAAPEAAHKRHDRTLPGFHHLAWNAESREQVDRFHTLLVDTGAQVLDPPAAYDYEPGYYAVFFADPDGMKLEFVHIPETGSQAYWSRFMAGEAGARHSGGCC